ncbi:peptidoglycan DD-metalloendopeptidase family protein [Chryseobacterium indologenes]|uniref:N-acetylmuramoyl-L-alanine amidase n=1 Tax=Chryseobacterium indologenes TaxID=253 RepID=UPI0023E83E60|nr:peptidoglycan DD-metalloendopeptidase family protein [Chryseobacterium indologenes]WET49288.1 peptidoglycan DD-metalloendopeptidase family protein [Chryseobacterium indologenes]
MAKKGVLKIIGNPSPKTGEKTIYKVTEWYPTTPAKERKESLVTWELFRKRDNGKFTTTNIKKQGIGEFTFRKDAWKYIYRIEGYIHHPEGKEPMSIIVKPQKNSTQAPPKEKKILEVKLVYQDGSPISKALNYKDQLRAIAKCQGLEGENITFTLWEDDENSKGHNPKNQFITKSSPIQVDSKGYARWNFGLLDTYISIANKREDDTKQHEYYVTANYNGKIGASDNVNANNPEYKAPTPPVKQPTGAQTLPQPSPQPNPDTPKGSTRPNSPNNQPDKQGAITKIKLTDKNGKEFTQNPKSGESIKILIEGNDIAGKNYVLKIWEHDSSGNNKPLYNRPQTFKENKEEITIPLTDEMQKSGGINDPKTNNGEYWKGGQHEIFAEVIFLNISTQSKAISVDPLEAPKKQDNGTTPTNKEKDTLPANKVCECEEFKLIWGKKVSCKFRKKVVAIAKDLWPNDYKNMANNLMAVFAWETGETFKTDIPNRKGSGATGLIQFLPERAQEYLGKCTMETVPNYFNSKDPKLHNLPRVKEFAEMKPEDQLDYVKKYFEDIRGKKLEFVDFYLKVLFPASMLKPEHYVFGLEKFKNEIGLASDSEKVRQKRVDKYSTNSGMDTFKDGKISKSEIALSIQPFITKGIPEIFTKGSTTQPQNSTDTKSKSDAVVITDAGHGIGGDPGAGSGPDTESVMTLEVETKTAESLAKLGIKNTRTRTTVLPSQKVDQVTFRANVFKNNNGKVMVSHHLNSVGDTFLIMYHPAKLNKLINPKKPKEGYTSVAGGSSPEFLKNSLTLGKYIKEELIKIGRKAELREATVPHTNYSSLGILRGVDGADNAGVLIEMGSVSDTNTKYLREHSQEIGNAIANGIAKYLNVKPGEKTENNLGECEEAAPIKAVPSSPTPTNDDQCPNGKCIHFADVVPNPVLNTQGGKNKNRFHGIPRVRTKKVNGKNVTYTYYHGATDILTKVGTPLHSLTCGEVVHIRTDLPQDDSVKGYESPTSYGNTIMIKSDIDGFGTVYFFYAHLSKVSVKVGQKVKHNDPIGLSGSTGNAMHVDVSVRHVHIEAGTQITSVKDLKCMIVKDKRIDPEQFMKTKFDKNGN